MKVEDITNTISEKLGEEGTAIIGDDIVSLITLENTRLKEIDDKKKEIETLKQKNEMLITANGNLMQQVSMGKDEMLEKEEPKETKRFSFRDVFDEKGHFKK